MLVFKKITERRVISRRKHNKKQKYQKAEQIRRHYPDESFFVKRPQFLRIRQSRSSRPFDHMSCVRKEKAKTRHHYHHIDENESVAVYRVSAYILYSDFCKEGRRILNREPRLLPEMEKSNDQDRSRAYSVQNIDSVCSDRLIHQMTSAILLVLFYQVFERSAIKMLFSSGIPPLFSGYVTKSFDLALVTAT